MGLKTLNKKNICWVAKNLYIFHHIRLICYFLTITGHCWIIFQRKRRSFQSCWHCFLSSNVWVEEMWFKLTSATDITQTWLQSSQISSSSWTIGCLQLAQIPKKFKQICYGATLPSEGSYCSLHHTAIYNESVCSKKYFSSGSNYELKDSLALKSHNAKTVAYSGA